MFVCKQCWYISSVKLGKCPNCHEFWTFEEQDEESRITSNKSKKWKILDFKINQIQSLDYQIENQEIQRVLPSIRQWWVYLLSWSPWVWKSTFVLQILWDILNNNENTDKKMNFAYFSWEEQVSDIFYRSQRINKQDLDIQIFQTNILEDILETTKANNFNLIVVDSIQTIYSLDLDSVSWSLQQVRYCADKLTRFAKQNNISVIIIGHITKTWDIAWPKYLEHIVDVVLNIDWDRLSETRFLRCFKNRFWATNEVWIFVMTSNWLKPVNDLTERILKNANLQQPWIVLWVWLDANRPVIVVVEVLLNKIYWKNPNISCVWVDYKRVEMITAIAKKYIWLNLENYDIYVNLPWEFKLYDSWLDLAILSAIYSAYYDKPLGEKYIFLWELTLWWKITKTRLHNKRLSIIPSNFSIIDYQKIQNVSDLKSK